MREGRKKEASKVIQTTKQSNTAHSRQSHVHLLLLNNYGLVLNQCLLVSLCVYRLSMTTERPKDRQYTSEDLDRYCMCACANISSYRMLHAYHKV